MGLPVRSASHSSSFGEESMRLASFFAVALAGLAFGCRKADTGLEGFVCHATNVLGEYGGTTVVAETWSQRNVMSIPRWRVCSRRSDPLTQVVLFTIESAFQESEPGFPILSIRNGSHTIRDAHGTYIYSLSTGAFETNFYPANVYTGDIRTNAEATEPLGPANGG